MRAVLPRFATQLFIYRAEHEPQCLTPASCIPQAWPKSALPGRLLSPAEPKIEAGSPTFWSCALRNALLSKNNSSGCLIPRRFSHAQLHPRIRAQPRACSLEEAGGSPGSHASRKHCLWATRRLAPRQGFSRFINFLINL